MRIAVSGHRGLPVEVAAMIANCIEVELNKLVPANESLVGLSCLADGADQIFAAAVLNRGGRLEVFVPSDDYRDRLPDLAKPQYDKLISQASVIHRCGHRESTSEAHMDASCLMVNRADHLIAVWDGKPARGYGGTADVVQYAQDNGVSISVVWPPGAYRI